MSKIFLIDDDEDDHFLFKVALEFINPALLCETAINGKIGLQQLKNSDVLPDIIFIDLNMPIMSGFDFLLQIKKEEKLSHLPVGIFSTSSLMQDNEMAEEFGARFFLTKPNDFQALRKKVQQILSAEFSTDDFISLM